MSKKGKTFIVVGLGVIGSAVAAQLEERGFRVIKVIQKNLNRPKRNTTTDYYLADASKFTEIKRVALSLKHDGVIVDSIICTVGKDKKTVPCKHRLARMQQFFPELFMEDVSLQYIGTRFIYEAMISNLAIGGSMVFVSSPTHEYSSYELSCRTKELIIADLQNKAQTKIRRVTILHTRFDYKGKEDLIHLPEQMAEQIISAAMCSFL